MTMHHFRKSPLSLAALACLLAGAAFGQNAKPAATPASAAQEAAPAAGDSVDKTVEKFFGLLTKGEVDEACDFLTKGTPIGDNLEWVANLKVKTKETIKASGDVQGYELVKIQNEGTHLMRSTYVALGKEYPLVWKFYFYRADKTWKLIDLRLEIGLSDVFEDNKPPQGAAEGR